MQGIKSTALCLLAGLGMSAQAAAPANIKIGLTQLTAKQCGNALSTSNVIIPGDCITYRIEVENLGSTTAHNVEISALIPEHTELHSAFRDVSNHQMLGTVTEHKADGKHIKTKLERLPGSQVTPVVLEYSVRVL